MELGVGRQDDRLRTDQASDCRMAAKGSRDRQQPPRRRGRGPADQHPPRKRRARAGLIICTSRSPAISGKDRGDAGRWKFQGLVLACPSGASTYLWAQPAPWGADVGDRSSRLLRRLQYPAAIALAEAEEGRINPPPSCERSERCTGRTCTSSRSPRPWIAASLLLAMTEVAAKAGQYLGRL